MNEVEHNLDRQIKRNYGIDALRIISMLMIVTLHLLGHGANIWQIESGTLRYSILWLFEITAFCSVNCYALISGYVGISSKYKYSNLVALWFQVVFYSVLFTIIMKAIHPEEVSCIDIIKSLFPVISSQYWFFTCYFILFLFIPILNKAVEHINKLRMGFVILLLVCFVSVFGVIYNAIFGGDVFKVNEGYSPWWLIIMYLIGAYIRKNNIFACVKKRWIAFVFVVSTALTWLIKVLFPIISQESISDLFVNYTSITVLISAVCLLLLFSHAKLNSVICRVVAFFTPLCFGVYLIHDHVLIRKYIVSVHFYFINSIEIPKMILAIIVCVIGVYIICSLIDYIRYTVFRVINIHNRLNNIELILKEKIKQKLSKG